MHTSLHIHMIYYYLVMTQKNANMTTTMFQIDDQRTKEAIFTIASSSFQSIVVEFLAINGGMW